MSDEKMNIKGMLSDAEDNEKRQRYNVPGSSEDTGKLYKQQKAAELKEMAEQYKVPDELPQTPAEAGRPKSESLANEAFARMREKLVQMDEKGAKSTLEDDEELPDHLKSE